MNYASINCTLYKTANMLCTTQSSSYLTQDVRISDILVVLQNGDVNKKIIVMVYENTNETVIRNFMTITFITLSGP